MVKIMAVDEKKIEEKVAEEKEYQYRVAPRYGVWTEEDKLLIQVALPGVHKEDIQMKALKDYFTLRATRDDILYSLDLEFGIDIEPESTKAEYNEGLLRVEMKRYKPLDHAFIVPIQ